MAAARGGREAQREEIIKVKREQAGAHLFYRRLRARATNKNIQRGQVVAAKWSAAVSSPGRGLLLLMLRRVFIGCASACVCGGNGGKRARRCRDFSLVVIARCFCEPS